MQLAVPPPIWAVYLVNKRDLIIVPIALGVAILLAFRVMRAFGWSEPSAANPLTLLPRWLVWFAAFGLFYLAVAAPLSGLSQFVDQLGRSNNWSFNPPIAPIVPNEPVLVLDAAVILIVALWTIMLGRTPPVEEAAEAIEAAPDDLAEPAEAPDRPDRVTSA